MFSLSIGYSTCPNDTFIFGALAKDEIETPFIFEPRLEDIETLNQLALTEELDVTKLSFPALGRVLSSYGLLNCGSALGRGCGPLVVARPGTDLSGLAQGRIAAPGEMTTARMLLSLHLGGEVAMEHMVFSDIMPAVAGGRADFGLIIHEGRFTYQDHGLVELLDLGKWWEAETGMPIPLGCIAIRRDLGMDMARGVDQAIRQSLMFAKSSPQVIEDYILGHAQETAPEIIAEHIRLYVNDFSLDLGEEGRAAIEALLTKAMEAKLIPEPSVPLMAY